MDVTVNVEYKDGDEGEIKIDLDLDDFAECETGSEKIEYIKDLAKKRSDKIKEVLFDKDGLSNLEAEIDDMDDTSAMLPNETYGEYMEHEGLD